MAVKISVGKCQTLHLGRCNEGVSHTSLDVAIPCVSTVKDFGITIDLHLDWLGTRVVSVLDSVAEGPGFKSQPRRCRVAVLGKLFTSICSPSSET